MLKGRKPLTVRPGSLTPAADFEAMTAEIEAILKRKATPEEIISYILYPQVFKDYVANQEKFGPMTFLDTPTFFQGMRVGERVDIEMGPGKVVIFQLQEIGEVDPEGMRTLYFDVNGTPIEIDVLDESVQVTTVARRKAEPTNPNEIGATMAGNVLSVHVENGQAVKQGDVMIVTEAMKMETTVQAPFDGTVKFVHVAAGEAVAGGDLLIEVEPG